MSVCVYVVSVVDRPETEALVEKALRREAVKALLSGAAIFFPDKHSRRDKLFHMMVSHAHLYSMLLLLLLLLLLFMMLYSRIG